MIYVEITYILTNVHIFVFLGLKISNLTTLPSPQPSYYRSLLSQIPALGLPSLFFYCRGKTDAHQGLKVQCVPPIPWNQLLSTPLILLRSRPKRSKSLLKDKTNTKGSMKLRTGRLKIHFFFLERVSLECRIWFGFTLLRKAIGLKNSCHFELSSNQK